MSGRMTLKQLTEKLADRQIVPLPEAQWRPLAAAFRVVEDIDTHLAGRILLVRPPVEGKKSPGWALVEDPAPGQKVVRPLRNEKEARALIADRLAAYERMWDG